MFHRRALPVAGRHRRAVDRRLDCCGEATVERRPSAETTTAFSHVVGFEVTAGAAPPRFNRTVLLAHSDPAVGKALASAGFTVRPIVFTPFDVAAAAKISTSIPTIARRRPSASPTSFALRGTRPGPRSLPTATRRWRRCSRVRSFPSRLLFSTWDGSIRRAMPAISSVCTFPGLRRAGDLQTAARARQGDAHYPQCWRSVCSARGQRSTGCDVGGGDCGGGQEISELLTATANAIRSRSREDREVPWFARRLRLSRCSR